jgi:two-component system, cell cycle response regulator
VIRFSRTLAWHAASGEPSVKAKLLLVEDSDVQGSTVKRTLETLGYQVSWARSGIEGLKLARTERPDLIILDVVMADVDGFAVCRWLKMTLDTRDIPVIMLTVKSEVHDRVEGLNVGANDYLPKPFADEELEARILAALRVRATQAELRERNQQLEAMIHRVEALAVTDPLTGLFNRRKFSDVLRREFAVTKRYRNELSCLMIDIDHFKLINDRHGHDFGDGVLKDVATTLMHNLREVDLACRYGGEEFAVLLPHTPKENALVVADRITRCVRELKLNYDGTSVPVSVSVGIASTKDITTNEAEELVRSADVALYEAKRLGRDRIVTFAAVTERPPA